MEEIEARGPQLDTVETTGASFMASAKVRLQRVLYSVREALDNVNLFGGGGGGG